VATVPGELPGWRSTSERTVEEDVEHLSMIPVVSVKSMGKSGTSQIVLENALVVLLLISKNMDLS